MHLSHLQQGGTKDLALLLLFFFADQQLSRALAWGFYIPKRTSISQILHPHRTESCDIGALLKSTFSPSCCSEEAVEAVPVCSAPVGDAASDAGCLGRSFRHLQT